VGVEGVGVESSLSTSYFISYNVTQHKLKRVVIINSVLLVEVEVVW